MAKHDFLVKLTHFANTDWPTVRLGHSVGAFDDKYPCANPEGPVDNSGCSDPESPDYDPNNPLCMCPCQELNPALHSNLVDFPWYVDIFTGFGAGAAIWNWLMGNSETVREPTIEQLKESAESIKECDLIKSKLGESWMGCLWKTQNHPSSCNCPCVGEDFKKYIEYSRTYSTYWDTPPTTPLWRASQMSLARAQTSVIVVNGDLTLRPGHLIYISAHQAGAMGKTKKFSGRWLVSDISHIIQGMQHKMALKLIRDSSPIDPNKSELDGKSWWEKIWNFITA
jgi:hypothetical protein